MNSKMNVTKLSYTLSYSCRVSDPMSCNTWQGKKGQVNSATAGLAEGLLRDDCRRYPVFLPFYFLFQADPL